MGRVGRNWLGRRDDRAGDRGGKPLVRGPSRPRCRTPTASNASGQLIFLPLLAALAEHFGWQSVPWAVALVIVALVPLVVLMLAKAPAASVLDPMEPRPNRQSLTTTANPFISAVAGLVPGVRSLDFWLLFSTFAICGFSTNGLVGTHLIPFCLDHGIAAVSAASRLARSMGVFDLIGTTLSGWLTDRYNARVLLFWSLRPARTVAVGAAVHQLRGREPVNLRRVLWTGLGRYGAAHVALTNEVFGKKDGAGDRLLDCLRPSNRRRAQHSAVA